MAQVTAEMPSIPAGHSIPNEGDEPTFPVGAPLPRVITPNSPSDALAALTTASRRGRLPGFEDRGQGHFQTAAFASPFDGYLSCHITSAPDSAAIITAEPRLKPTTPAIFALVLLLSIWPGVVLTESLIASFFPGSAAWRYTWWWYLPLTVPTSPWAFWVAIKRSRAAVRISALEMLKRIAKETAGRLENPPPTTR